MPAKKSICRALAYGLALVVSLATLAGPGLARADGGGHYIWVFSPANEVRDSLATTLSALAAPDVHVDSSTVTAPTWEEVGALSLHIRSYIKSKGPQGPDNVHGVYVACKSAGMFELYPALRELVPELTVVDSFGAAMMAANIVSDRYAVFTGNPSNEPYIQLLVDRLGIGSHLVRKLNATEESPYLITVKQLNYGDGDFDVLPWLLPASSGIIRNFFAESIVLTGCEGFMSPTIAQQLEMQLADNVDPNQPTNAQVIDPHMAAFAFLESAMRNRLWTTMGGQGLGAKVTEGAR